MRFKREKEIIDDEYEKNKFKHKRASYIRRYMCKSAHDIWISYSITIKFFYKES